MEISDVSLMAHIKVEDNFHNEVNIKDEQLAAPPQEPLPTDHHDIKIENDIDEEILLTPSEKLEEENWESYYAGAAETDPLKLEEDIADGAIIKFENQETSPKIEDYFKEEREELPSNNYSDIKYESDEGIFGATKVNEALWRVLAKKKIFKKTQKKLKRDSAAYLRQREMANARKRKFLDTMTEERKEIKRAKDREYYQNKKAENKLKKIADMTEREKRKQRKNWKNASKKYRKKKKDFI